MNIEQMLRDAIESKTTRIMQAIQKMTRSI